MNGTLVKANLEAIKEAFENGTAKEELAKGKNSYAIIYDDWEKREDGQPELTVILVAKRVEFLRAIMEATAEAVTLPDGEYRERPNES